MRKVEIFLNAIVRFMWSFYDLVLHVIDASVCYEHFVFRSIKILFIVRDQKAARITFLVVISN